MKSGTDIVLKSHKRNYGIDLLRLISMVYVVFLHAFGHGGLLHASLEFSRDYKIVYFLEIFFYPAVDIFGIISGYVMCDRKAKISNLLKIWFQVLFYSLGCVIFFSIFASGSVIKSDYIKSLFPIMFNVYWYITCYFGLFIISPIIIEGCKKISKYSARKYLIVLLIFYSCMGILFQNYQLSNGYSVIWLLILFITGIIIRKCDLRVKKIYCFLGIIILSFIAWIFNFYGFEYNGIISISKDILISYVSPTVYLCAILYILLFEKIKFSEGVNKLITYFAASSLAIYLLNDNYLIRNNFIKNEFAKIYFSCSLFKTLLFVFIFSILFSIICLIIDKVRILIFSIIRKKIIKSHLVELFFNRLVKKLL